MRFLLIAFAMFTVACEEKPVTPLDERDAGSIVKEETKNEAEKATAAVEEVLEKESPKAEKAKAK